MDKEFYSEIQFSPSNLSYTFVSVGRHGEILQIVVFQEVEANIYNLFLGDFINNTVSDDQSITDNGDLLKVMATVVQIVGLFMSQHPDASVLITGSDWVRKRLYARIVHTYCSDFQKLYEIQCTEEKRFGYKPYSALDKEFVPYSFLFRLKIA